MLPQTEHSCFSGKEKPMTPSKDQKALLSAIRAGRLDQVKRLLERDDIDPNFSGAFGVTPLHEAVRYNDLAMVKQLVAAGADVNAKDRNGLTPLEMAQEFHAEREVNFSPIIRYLSGVKGGKVLQTPQKPAKPVFTAETLPETFEPSKWVGNVKEMQELWEQVPAPLKKKFNFAAAMAEARQQTLKNKAPGKVDLKKPHLPPSS